MKVLTGILWLVLAALMLPFIVMGLAIRIAMHGYEVASGLYQDLLVMLMQGWD